jgi:hypothetical protein
MHMPRVVCYRLGCTLYKDVNFISSQNYHVGVPLLREAVERVFLQLCEVFPRLDGWITPSHCDDLASKTMFQCHLFQTTLNDYRGRIDDHVGHTTAGTEESVVDHTGAY